MLKYNCKYAPAKKCEIRNFFTYWGGDSQNEKVTGKVFKKIKNFKKSLITPTSTLSNRSGTRHVRSD